MSDAMKVGLVMGGGDLPAAVIEGCARAGHDIFIVRLDGYADDIEQGLDSEIIGLAKFGTMIKRFRAKNCTHICFAGDVKRPDFKTLKPDFGGWRKLPGALSAARQGDDALLSYILEMFEAAGFEIIAPQTLSAHILMPDGHLGRMKMSPDMRADAEKACRIAKDMGALDIGQGAVVCAGLTLAVEAAEGTDMMLERIAHLPEAIRGTEASRRGVLAKMVKPGQETRVDLPTIGLKTVELAARAGLAGIVTEGGRSFLLDREAVIKAADAAGIFIAGLPSGDSL
ncbi:LpxI family protein [Fretibacter rubidus]|uniref:LpxI family protein n=1 Tax=Fretibacter rubidus TaxID=570162 RepID=UPI00352A4011